MSSLWKRQQAPFSAGLEMEDKENKTQNTSYGKIQEKDGATEIN